MRATAFSIRGTDEAWRRHWHKLPEPGWHDLFALTKRGAASMEGDLRPLLQNLQYFKDLLALYREEHNKNNGLRRAQSSGDSHPPPAWKTPNSLKPTMPSVVFRRDPPNSVVPGRLTSSQGARFP